jgi:predicted cupin superfamily sugar epimerase
LRHPEIYSFHAGAPARMLLLHPDGTVTRPVLGIDLAAGQRPQVAVPAGVWQATETTGEWTLLGTFMAPPYTDDCVEFGDDRLTAEFPQAAGDIERLAVMSREVGQPGDGWLTSDRAVGSVVIVEVEPAW